MKRSVVRIRDQAFCFCLLLQQDDRLMPLTWNFCEEKCVLHITSVRRARHRYLLGLKLLNWNLKPQERSCLPRFNSRKKMLQLNLTNSFILLSLFHKTDSSTPIKSSLFSKVDSHNAYTINTTDSAAFYSTAWNENSEITSLLCLALPDTWVFVILHRG